MKFFSTRWLKVSFAGNIFQRKIGPRRDHRAVLCDPQSAAQNKRHAAVIRSSVATMPAQRIPQQDIVRVEKENVRRARGGKAGIPAPR